MHGTALQNTYSRGGGHQLAREKEGEGPLQMQLNFPSMDPARY